MGFNSQHSMQLFNDFNVYLCDVVITDKLQKSLEMKQQLCQKFNSECYTSWNGFNFKVAADSIELLPQAVQFQGPAREGEIKNTAMIYKYEPMPIYPENKRYQGD